MKNLAITLAIGVANATICVVIALLTKPPEWAALPLAIIGAVALFELEPRLRARFGQRHLLSLVGLALASVLAFQTTAEPTRAHGGGLNVDERSHARDLLFSGSKTGSTDRFRSLG